MASGNFYDEGALRQTAINLFHGWGYNFYRLENQFRADDQLVRGKASWLLGMAAQRVEVEESAYRRDFFGTPSRAKPFPDPRITAAAQRLELFAKAIGAIKGRLQALPAPENDRMTQRYRGEASTLEALIACDEQLVGQCALLQGTLEPLSAVAILEQIPALETGLAAIQSTLRNREALLHDRLT